MFFILPQYKAAFCTLITDVTQARRALTWIAVDAIYGNGKNVFLTPKELNLAINALQVSSTPSELVHFDSKPVDFIYGYSCSTPSELCLRNIS